jgi:hypothetical protein
MKFFICLFLSLISIGSYAQIDSSKTNFDCALGANVTGGNYTSYTVNIKSNISKDWKSNQINWSPSFEYSKISNNGDMQLREREIYSSLNYVRSMKEFKFYLFNEMEHSYLQKVDFRGSLGLGFGHKIVKTKSFEFDISEMVMGESMLSNFGRNSDNIAVRSSTRLKLKWSNGKLKFNSISFFQPALYTVKNGGDVVSFNDNLNFRITTTFESKISKLFSLGLGNSLTYESYSHSIKASTNPLDYTFYFFIKLN